MAVEPEALVVLLSLHPSYPEVPEFVLARSVVLGLDHYFQI